MARIRTIKPDFCASNSVSRISRDARLFFLQLLTETDDEGRMRWLPKKIAGALYPNDEDVDALLIEAWTEECEAEGMLLRYCVEGVTYLCFPKFGEHQRVAHATPSRIPAPDSLNESSREFHEEIAKVSGEPHELLTGKSGLEREVGKGSRKGKRESAKAETTGAGEGEPAGEKPESEPKRRPDAAEMWDALPESHRQEALKLSMAGYFKMRHERKWGRLAPETIKERAKAYGEFPVEALIWAFLESVKQGWQGVFPEKWQPPGDPGRGANRRSPGPKPSGESVEEIATRRAAAVNARRLERAEAEECSRN